jgi:hypothetical protein
MTMGPIKKRPTSIRLEIAIIARPGMTAFDAGTAAGITMPGTSGAAVHVALRSLCSQGRLRRERGKNGMFRYYPAGAALFRKNDPAHATLENAKPLQDPITSPVMRNAADEAVRRPVDLSAPRKCIKCKKKRPTRDFLSKTGKVLKHCSRCLGRARDRMRERHAPPMERLAARPARRDKSPAGRVRFVFRSANRKTGPIPVSTSERGTCPPSCTFYKAGCYADYGKLGHHWRGTEDRGLPWDEFVRRIAMLVPGQIWRHNVAGDLPGEGEAIDAAMLSRLVRANRGKRGFTFTHKHASARNREAIKKANAQGFAVNLSADSVEDVDRLLDYKVGPAVVVLPEDAPDKLETPAGRSIVVCPAETTKNAVQCRDCGLCAKTWRKVVIGFRAHGPDKMLVSQLVRSRRPSGAEGSAEAC